MMLFQIEKADKLSFSYIYQAPLGKTICSLHEQPLPNSACGLFIILHHPFITLAPLKTLLLKIDLQQLKDVTMGITYKSYCLIKNTVYIYEKLSFKGQDHEPNLICENRFLVSIQDIIESCVDKLHCNTYNGY